MKQYLLDTHTLIWFLQGAHELPDATALRIEDPRADVAVSMATIWEMAIKISLGKLRVPYTLDTELPQLLSENNVQAIDPTFTHYQALTTLPYHHRDPFDRLMVIQAMHERRVLISRDPTLKLYNVKCVWDG